MPLGIWHFSQWAGHTLYLPVVHPAVHMSQVLESVTTLSACCGHRVPSNSPVQHLDRPRGSVYRFLSVNAKKLSREPS